MATDDRNLVGYVLGECKLEKVIGQGGMSSVYLGRQMRPARNVAVKVLGSGMNSNNTEDYQMFLTRFRREADIIAKLEHINIIPLYAYGEENRLAYIIMPYISGGSLNDAISKQGKLSLQQTFIYLQQAAAALDYAHAHNVVHRDLKPSNFLLYPEGNRLVLADFGIARIAAANPYSTQENTLTQAGAIPGTLGYMAPEMLRDSKNIDSRVDIYALGIVLYQMLSGELPFVGDLFVLINKHLSEPLPLLHERDLNIPASIDSVLSKATAKAREERYATAGELVNDFRRAMNTASASAGAGSWNNPVTPLLGISVPVRDPSIWTPSGESGSADASRGTPGAMVPVQDNNIGAIKQNNYLFPSNRDSTDRARGNIQPPQQAYGGPTSVPDVSMRAYPPLQDYEQTTSVDQHNPVQALSSMRGNSLPGAPVLEKGRQPKRHPKRGGILVLIALLVLSGGLIGVWTVATHRLGPVPAPVPVHSTPMTEAEQVIQAYYTDINERNYQAAFNLLTPKFQSYLGYNNFVNGYANTKHDDINFERATQVSISEVNVVITIHALETRAQGNVIATYHISYIVVRIGGAWKIQGGVSV